MSKSVIFDTNAYRKLFANLHLEEIKEKVKAIKKIEKMQGIKAFGSLHTGMELINNLAKDKGDNNYRECLSGVVGMAEHIYDSNQDKLSFIGTPYQQIAMLFNVRTEEKYAENAKNMLGMIGDFRNNWEIAIKYHTDNGNIQKTSNYVSEEEKKFVEFIITMNNNLINEVERNNPKTYKKDIYKKIIKFIEDEKFEVFLSMVIIYAFAIRLNIHRDDKKFSFLAEQLYRNFPVAIRFYKLILLELNLKGIDLNSRSSQRNLWNWHWDYQIAFGISDTTLDSAETLLVSNDNGIIKVIESLGFQNKVLKIEEYLKLINVSIA